MKLQLSTYKISKIELCFLNRNQYTVTQLFYLNTSQLYWRVFAIPFDVSSLHVIPIHGFRQTALSRLLIISRTYGHLPELGWTIWWTEAHSWTAAGIQSFTLSFRNIMFLGENSRSIQVGLTNKKKSSSKSQIIWAGHIICELRAQCHC